VSLCVAAAVAASRFTATARFGGGFNFTAPNLSASPHPPPLPAQSRTSQLSPPSVLTQAYSASDNAIGLLPRVMPVSSWRGFFLVVNPMVSGARKVRSDLGLLLQVNNPEQFAYWPRHTSAIFVTRAAGLRDRQAGPEIGLIQAKLPTEFEGINLFLGAHLGTV